MVQFQWNHPLFICHRHNCWRLLIYFNLTAFTAFQTFFGLTPFKRILNIRSYTLQENHLLMCPVGCCLLLSEVKYYVYAGLTPFVNILLKQFRSLQVSYLPASKLLSRRLSDMTLHLHRNRSPFLALGSFFFLSLFCDSNIT